MRASESRAIPTVTTYWHSMIRTLALLQYVRISESFVAMAYWGVLNSVLNSGSRMLNSASGRLEVLDSENL